MSYPEGAPRVVGPTEFDRYQEHLQREMEILSAMQSDDDEPYDDVATAMFQLALAYAKQLRPGMTPEYIAKCVERLMKSFPLTPLTGEDDEWRPAFAGVKQNIRYSKVFMDASGPYNVEGIIFERPDGTRNTNGHSRVAITFPYIPTAEIVKVDFEGRILENQG